MQMKILGSVMAGLSVFLLPSTAASAHGLPGHGSFAFGQGHITKDGGQLTVDQSSSAGIVNWSSFSIGKKNGVTFDNGHGATLNIVNGNNLSQISGDLHGTGSVYLINRAGVLVTGSGRVDTQGSFIASSRDANMDAFADSKHIHLTGTAEGNVINRGAITSGANVTLYGSTTRAGTIAAKGNVETSGNHVGLGSASISAKHWLVDPTNLTVTPSSAKTIARSLNKGTDVSLKTGASGASGPGKKSKGAGDIIIAAPIAWSGKASLHLNAFHDIDFKNEVIVRGSGTVGLQASNGSLTFDHGSVTFKKTTAHLEINGQSYELVNSIPLLAKGISASPSGLFALSADYNAAQNGTYHASPIAHFSGTFEGLGHTIKNFSMNSKAISVGLFSKISRKGIVRDVNFAAASIVAMPAETDSMIGILAAENMGTIGGISASGTLHVSKQESADIGGLVGIDAASGAILSSSDNVKVVVAAEDFSDSSIGGLAGQNQGKISDSSSAGELSSATYSDAVGGLVGIELKGSITASYASGALDVQGYAGGLVGRNEDGKISGSYATGKLKGKLQYAGGLVGINEAGGLISNSWASGTLDLTLTGTVGGYQSAGGLVGWNTATIENSYAIGAVSGAAVVGGLVGDNDGGGKVLASHSSGDVIGTSHGNGAGGFVGFNGGSIEDSYVSGNVSVNGKGVGAGYGLGGFVGTSFTDSLIDTAYSTGTVTGGNSAGGGYYVGGFAGYVDGRILHAYETGAVSAGSNAELGGFVGTVGGDTDSKGHGASIQQAYAIGRVELLTGAKFSDVGGFAGESPNGTLSDSYWDKTTTKQTSSNGGTGRTTEQLKSGLPSGFDSAWAISSTINRGFPYLKALSASY